MVSWWVHVCFLMGYFLFLVGFLADSSCFIYGFAVVSLLLRATLFVVSLCFLLGFLLVSSVMF